MQPCRAGGAVVVDIVDGNLRHAELVEDALAAGRVAIAVACDALFDIVVVDLSVEEGFDARFEAEFGVVDCIENLERLKGVRRIHLGHPTFASGFDEFGQTYA